LENHTPKGKCPRYISGQAACGNVNSLVVRISSLACRKCATEAEGERRSHVSLRARKGCQNQARAGACSEPVAGFSAGYQFRTPALHPQCGASTVPGKTRAEQAWAFSYSLDLKGRSFRR
jgi:hypothetical protein